MIVGLSDVIVIEYIFCFDGLDNNFLFGVCYKGDSKIVVMLWVLSVLLYYWCDFYIVF